MRMWRICMAVAVMTSQPAVAVDFLSGFFGGVLGCGLAHPCTDLRTVSVRRSVEVRSPEPVR